MSSRLASSASSRNRPAICRDVRDRFKLASTRTPVPELRKEANWPPRYIPALRLQPLAPIRALSKNRSPSSLWISQLAMGPILARQSPASIVTRMLSLGTSESRCVVHGVITWTLRLPQERHHL